MNVVLLSGGSGKRLWPLSNDVRSKQFLKVFRRGDGTRESMIQRMSRMIKEVEPSSSITIATSENQVASIRTQLGMDVDVSIEPCRRDTFPAIALSVAYLHDVKRIEADEPVVVCPVDPYVEKDYFERLQHLRDRVTEGNAKIILMGVVPTYPSEKYGYIMPKAKDTVSSVEFFIEKPNSSVAEKYIEQGALWNAGVFAFRLRYVLDLAKKEFGTADYNELYEKYNSLKKISFDYAVVEKEPEIEVVRFGGDWKDLGTWNTLTETMSEEVSGNAIAADCRNTHVINELQIPLVALGLENVAIAATPDGILVADKNHSDQLKKYITNQRPMYEKRVWGEYNVLDYRVQKDGLNSLTKHLVIKEGQHISYQRHRYRSEIWTITDGNGKIILDGKITDVARGDTVLITPGMKHAIKADKELHIIEVQIGDELTEEDIERLDWDWEAVN